MKVSDNTNIQLPLRNLISIIAGVAVAVWAYFGIIERLNTIETNGKLMIVDVEKNLWIKSTKQILLIRNS